jgi:tetratricopeptide (TPR) repeat protein
VDWKTINSRYVHPAIEACKAGRVEEAERLFKEGLVASHEDGYVALRFAECLESLGRVDDAAPLFELALRRLPKADWKLKAKEGLDRIAATPRGRSFPEIVAQEHAPDWKPTAGGLERLAPATHTASARVGLLSCTKNKKPYVCTARELYSESENFRRHLAFAESHYAKTFVASAKHGLVALDQLLAPYDFNLDEYAVEERDVWARFIAARLHLEGIGENHSVYIHATDKYGIPLRDALDRYRISSRIIDFEGVPTEEDLNG